MRLGYGLVERSGEGYQLHASGILGLDRLDGEAFGAYRERLIEYWVSDGFLELVTIGHAGMEAHTHAFAPSAFTLASEIVPAVGSGNFIQATQSELVKTAITTIHARFQLAGLPWGEIAGSSVKKAVFGAASKPPKPGTKKRRQVTKVDMRNAVFEVFPQLQERKWEVDLFPDEVDGIAVALAKLGYKRPKHG